MSEPVDENSETPEKERIDRSDTKSHRLPRQLKQQRHEKGLPKGDKIIYKEQSSTMRE